MTMLAEIFILRLETLLRIPTSSRTTTADDPRFVPVKLPREGQPEAASSERVWE
jgi:hypothetical protein